MPTKDPEYYAEALRQRVGTLGKRRIAAVVAAAMLVGLGWSTWFTVQPEETGVVQRFGAVDRTVDPGLHFKLPIGIEVNEARQDRERTINQAQEQANREIPKARGEATRTVTEAEGYAVERVMSRQRPVPDRA